MFGGKGHTPVSNWNAIMYELTWLQGGGAGGVEEEDDKEEEEKEEEAGVIERWIPSCDVWLLLYTTVDIPQLMDHEWVHRR